MNADHKIFAALETFRIELPSWGFANTGTRFGKFIQPAAATTTEEKFSDAGQVHQLTGVCPTVALHVLWDCPDGVRSTDDIKKLCRPLRRAARLDQSQSFPGPGIQVRIFRQSGSLRFASGALQHTKDSIEIARRLHSRDISLWFADGSNYPGTANIRQRKEWFKEGLRESHDASCLQSSDCWSSTSRSSRPFITPISPIGAWRCCWLVPPGRKRKCWWIPDITMRRKTSSRSWRGCLSEDMLGGFHFNDRRYADDDLTFGSIDPYQVFRIFHEIRLLRMGDGRASRHRVHGRPEPQPQGQDRGDDSDRDDGADSYLPKRLWWTQKLGCGAEEM